MISDEEIKSLVSAVVEASDPDKVILFGSYATGKAGGDSDVDIFVVKDSNLPRHKRARLIRQSIRGRFPFPKDIVVYTPSEVKEWANVSQSFTASVMKTGKVMYEKRR
jgi:predicted nucleotidyltransferase